MAFHRQVGRKLIDRIMTFEPATLILFAAAAGGLFVFLQLTGEVMEGDTRAFDESILLLLRQSDDLHRPIGPFWLPHAMDDITALGGTAVLSLMTVIITGYLLLAKRRAIAVFTFAAVVGGWISTLFGFGKVDGFNFGSFVVAVIGALVVLFIYRKVRS